MGYAEALTRALIDRVRDRRLDDVIDPATLPGADDDLTPAQRDALMALDAAIDRLTWASVNQARWCWRLLWPDRPTPSYASMRSTLYRLQRDGYLVASPKGQPPGMGGLLFRLTPRGRVAVIDARARWSSP